MITIERFKNDLIEMLKKNDAIKGCEIKGMSKQKNNGVEKNSITITEKDAIVAPTIYVDEAYEKYVTGEASYEEIAERIVNIYLKEKDVPGFTMNVANWDEVKDLVCYKLINTEANEELLKSVPSIPYQDLSIVFYVIVKDIKPGSFGSILIRNKLAEIWDKDSQELMEVARINTPRELPAKFQTMKELLMEQGIPEFMLEGTPEMYILSNCEGHLGAGAILYPGVLDELLEERGDMVVLPSSIHDTLLMPLSLMKEGDNATSLSALIKEVNGGDLVPEEVLSDHPYIYTKKEQLKAMA